MIKIIQVGNPILRDTAKDVPLNEISSIKIKKILDKMSKILGGEKDGIALAAPQIGAPLRIFIVSDKIFNFKKNDDENTVSASPAAFSNLIFINPTIIKLSKNSEGSEEGCLSMYGKYGIVNRAKKMTIRAYDENGKIFERGASGLLAKIFQHEIDHLNGILFIDKAKKIYDAK